MPTRNVVLTDHQAELIEKLVASGRFQNASEVIRSGLRLVEEHNADYEAKVQALRDAIQVGIDDFEAGRFITLKSEADIDAFFSEIVEEVIADRKS